MSFSPKDGIREVSAIALEDYREIDRIHLARIRNKEMYVRGYGQGLEPIERDEVLKGQFKAFIQTYKYPIITHNAAFDRNVLRYWKWIDKNQLFYSSRVPFLKKKTPFVTTFLPNLILGIDQHIHDKM